MAIKTPKFIDLPNDQFASATALVDGSGNLSASNAASGFGEQLSAQMTPVIQLKFPYHINTVLTNQSVTGSGAVSYSRPFAVCSTTAATSSSARLESSRAVTYRTGQGIAVRFTAVFTTGVDGSTQWAGLFDADNGYAIGFNGDTFSVLRRSGTSDTVTPRASFLYDSLDGTGFSGITLDPTNGNVFEIVFPWLGFGPIDFKVQKQNGQFITFHKIEYPNNFTVTSTVNPSFPLAIEATNTTNNTDIVVKTPSMAAFLQGNLQFTSLSWAYGRALAGVTTEVHLFTIRNMSTFKTYTNKNNFILKSIGMQMEGTGNATGTVRLWEDYAMGGTPSFADINTANSFAEVDTAGTVAAGTPGRLIQYFPVNESSAFAFNLLPYMYTIAPGSSVSLTVEASGSSNFNVGLGWVEDL